MTKSNYFFGQSVFGQLISLLDLNKIRAISKKHMSDYYVKKFDTSDHLISMLFSTFANCTVTAFYIVSVSIFLSDRQI